jgi:hypothetical protein
MDSLYHIIYQSTALADFSGPELGRLLHQSQVHNQAANVTGVLLYDGTQFLQVLEGEKCAIESIFARILLDCRHTDVQILANGPAEQRQFHSWSMGLMNYAPKADSTIYDARQALLQVTDTALWLLLHDFQLHACRTPRRTMKA